LAANKRKILANAQKYLQKGQLDKALKEYQTLVELDPRDANSRLKLGDVHLRRNDRDAAIEAYKKVAAQFTKDGFDAKAVALYKQIAKIDDKRWEIYEPLAELYERLGLTAEALAALQTAADAYRREGRRREALELLRKMASLDPTNTTSRLKIADLLVQAEMPEDALAEYEAVAEELERQGAQEQLPAVYERMLELAPERPGPLAALARVLVAQGQRERAEPFARRLVEVDPDSLDGHELLAEILRAQGREDAAEASYRRLAELYRMRGDEENAREIAQRFLSGEDLSAVGGELEGDPEDSLIGGLGGPGEPIATQAAAENPSAATKGSAGSSAPSPAAGDGTQEAEAAGDPEQLLAEARVYLRYRKLERAAATLESLLAAEPDHLEALECLGEVRVEANDRDGAVQTWLRGVEVARRVGDLQTARELGERVASLDPSAAPGPEAPGAEADESFDLSAGEPTDPDAGPATLDDVDLEIEIGDERLEEDADLQEAGGAAAGLGAREDGSSPEPEASSLQTDAGDGDSLAGGDEELDFDVDISLSGFDEPPLEEAEVGRPPAGAESSGEMELESLDWQDGESDGTETGHEADAERAAPRGDATSEEADARQGGSSTTPQQIAEDLEEADFYVQQGMLDEAETVCRRILAAAPNHPQAQLRLGEIIERRGGDPGSSGVGGADAAGAGPAETSEAPDEGGGEPDGDLGADLVSWDESEEDARPHEARGGEDDLAPDSADADPEIDVDLDLDVDFDASATDDGSDATADASGEPTEAAFALDDDSEDASEAERPGGADLAAGLSETQPELPEEAEREVAETPEEAPDETGPPPEPDAPSPEPVPAASAGAEAEEATFDLAAELSDVFEDDEKGDSLSGVSDHGFEAVFREFKKGVREQLSESDYEAHYDLGIAYREMGLCEDALAEFRIALASPERKLACLHMLGLCALDLGRSEDATSHLEQALALPDIPEPEQAALRFDLGRAFEARGDLARARAAYEAVSEVDPDYQDVASRLQALISGGGASAESGLASDDDEEAVETFESFDDLIAEAEAIMGEDEGEEADSGDSGPRVGVDERRSNVPPEAAEDDTQPDPSPPPRKKRKISFL